MRTFLLISLFFPSFSAALSHLRSPTTPSETTASNILEASIITLKKNEVSNNIQSQNQLTNKMQAITESAQINKIQAMHEQANLDQAMQNTQTQLTQAILASVQNFTNSTENATAHNYFMMKDGLQSKQMMDDLAPTETVPPTTNHWKEVPNEWATAVKQVHYETSDGKTDGLKLPFKNYTFGMKPIAKTLTREKLLKQIENIKNVGEYVRTKDKTAAMKVDVNASTIDRYETAMQESLEQASPPEIFGDNLVVDDPVSEQ